jgi:hypothetical protein
MSRCVNNRYGVSQDTAGGVSIKGGQVRGFLQKGRESGGELLCSAAWDGY